MKSVNGSFEESEAREMISLFIKIAWLLAVVSGSAARYSGIAAYQLIHPVSN